MPTKVDDASVATLGVTEIGATRRGVMSGGGSGPLVPVNVVPPVISGTAQVGHILTASTGTWNNNPTSFAYQWYTSG